MERKKLEESEIHSRLNELPGWQTEAGFLLKQFKFANFADALNFVNRVGEIAERYDHHPDIFFGWGYAGIKLTTHDRGGITDFDFAVAKEIGNLMDN